MFPGQSQHVCLNLTSLYKAHWCKRTWLCQRFTSEAEEIENKVDCGWYWEVTAHAATMALMMSNSNRTGMSEKFINSVELLVKEPPHQNCFSDRKSFRRWVACWNVKSQKQKIVTLWWILSFDLESTSCRPTVSRLHQTNKTADALWNLCYRGKQMINHCFSSQWRD